MTAEARFVFSRPNAGLASAAKQSFNAGVTKRSFVTRVKSRKVVEASRRLGERFDAWQQGRISFGEFDASVQGWIAHVRYADSWGLRRQVLGRFVW